MYFLSDRRTEIRDRLNLTAAELSTFDTFLLGFFFQSISEDTRSAAIEAVITFIENGRKQADRHQG